MFHSQTHYLQDHLVESDRKAGLGQAFSRSVDGLNRVGVAIRTSDSATNAATVAAAAAAAAATGAGDAEQTAASPNLLRFGCVRECVCACLCMCGCVFRITCFSRIHKYAYTHAETHLHGAAQLFVTPASMACASAVPPNRNTNLFCHRRS